MAKAIWDEGGERKEGETKDGEAASAAGGDREETNGVDAGSLQEGN
jgi:hypothetical protein